MLYRLKEAEAIVLKGLPVMVAGSPDLMSRLPRGNWIGGSTPLLMTGTGVGDSRDRLLVTPMPTSAKLLSIQRYGVGGLNYLAEDSPVNGFTIVIVPYGCLVHHTLALEAPDYPNLFSKSIAGWICAPRGEHMGERAQVFYGPTCHAIEDEAIAIHMELPNELRAEMDILTAFDLGDGPCITFPEDGFTVTNAYVDGNLVVFSEYLRGLNHVLHIPLVGELHGTKLIAELRHYDAHTELVTFHAPVFHNVAYRFASKSSNLRERARQMLAQCSPDLDFCCICSSIYANGELGEYASGCVDAPVTFGEIANILINQAIVRLRVVNQTNP